MYTGEERRKEIRQNFCEAHIPMTNSIVEIKTILKNIETNITQGITFKSAMVGSMVGIVVLFMVQIGGFLFLYGKLTERVERNTGIIAGQQTQIDLLRDKIK
jgi:hypothetical protein